MPGAAAQAAALHQSLACQTVTLTQSKSGPSIRNNTVLLTAGNTQGWRPAFAGPPAAHDTVQFPAVVRRPSPATAACTVQKNSLPLRCHAGASWLRWYWLRHIGDA